MRLVTRSLSLGTQGPPLYLPWLVVPKLARSDFARFSRGESANASLKAACVTGPTPYWTQAATRFLRSLPLSRVYIMRLITSISLSPISTKDPDLRACSFGTECSPTHFAQSISPPRLHVQPLTTDKTSPGTPGNAKTWIQLRCIVSDRPEAALRTRGLSGECRPASTRPFIRLAVLPHRVGAVDIVRRGSP